MTISHSAVSEARNAEKPYSGQFIAPVSDLHRDLVAIAKATGTSLNAVVIEYLKRESEGACKAATSSPQRVNLPIVSCRPAG